ncbi:hypothetical protein OG897_30485 [Streptomyces sp. NBC_00237]|nr:hypothetical protein [Streptomyces sp. NBC_00237]MCX5205766.1 hypothetical protein [Streptomyces sp. NBC_00237]
MCSTSCTATVSPCASTTARSLPWTSPPATLLSTVKFMVQTVAAVGELQ